MSSIQLKDLHGYGAMLCGIYSPKRFDSGLGRSFSEANALLVDLQNPTLGPFDIFEHTPQKDYILVVDRLLRKNEPPYIRAYPLVLVDGIYQVKRGMASGNFLYTTDSRYRRAVCDYPIPIHDRFEDQF